VCGKIRVDHRSSQKLTPKKKDPKNISRPYRRRRRAKKKQAPKRKEASKVKKKKEKVGGTAMSRRESCPRPLVTRIRKGKEFAERQERSGKNSTTLLLKPNAIAKLGKPRKTPGNSTAKGRNQKGKKKELHEKKAKRRGHQFQGGTRRKLTKTNSSSNIEYLKKAIASGESYRSSWGKEGLFLDEIDEPALQAATEKVTAKAEALARETVSKSWCKKGGKEEYLPTFPRQQKKDSELKADIQEDSSQRGVPEEKNPSPLWGAYTS